MQTPDSNYLKVYNESKKHNDINIKNCIYIETKYKYKKHIQHASKQTNKQKNKQKIMKKIVCTAQAQCNEKKFDEIICCLQKY